MDTSAAVSKGILIGGEWHAAAQAIEVRNPFDGRLVGTVASATPADVDRAIAAAGAALADPWPAHARYDVLTKAAARIEQRADEYARAIAREGSKTIREARREPPRAATILRLCAEMGRQLAGETLPFDSRVGSERRVGYYTRNPVGIVAAITPFNDPLAMAAHKTGPALGAANAVVLKPASATPFSALMLAEDLVAAGLPAGRLNVVTGSGQVLGEALARDPRVRLVSFTGGVETGERITRIAGIKKLSMELGSNSPVIVLPDAKLDAAASAIVAGGFAQAGQNCLGVQRVILHRGIYDEMRERIVAAVRRLVTGVSTDERTDVCAMINESQAVRLESWIQEAIAGGASIAAGGERAGAMLAPAVLENVAAGARLDKDEAYGPVISLYRVDSLDEAITLANRVDYGLHAAIFTESLRDAFAAAQGLHVGAVIVNDSTDYRLDVMPFGGTKLSGIGREGIKFAMTEMTETRVICLNL
ncbi:MAG TPA: aldehyde dehydrogenase family protein [Vicinamibacterales bacterium]